MTDKPINLNQHRGMAAQTAATELRRLLAEVAANEQELRLRQDELEAHLVAAPAADWLEAAEKARYLIGLIGETSVGQDPESAQAPQRHFRETYRPAKEKVEEAVERDTFFAAEGAKEFGLVDKVIERRPEGIDKS